ncbi:hypothetical protein AGMMS50276_21640 [Synergistales bacterium]|nr:hypothetical protein AGMMS50276_21640 [Synergistales bacterium]
MMKNKKRIWLNHWFSAAYFIIELLREEFFVIGSNQNENCVYQKVCDAWFVEPEYEHDGQYVDFCLDFVRENNIDIFIPKRGMEAIAKRISEFAAMGASVMAESYQKIALLADKAATYNALRGSNIVPPFSVVNDLSGFEEAYAKLKTKDNRICVKFSSDEGALSFRVIDDSVAGYGGLFRGRGSKITYSEAIKTLGSLERFADMLVMPYLSGVEISADCLATDSGDIIIPRYKSGRIEEVKYDSCVTASCSKITKKFGLEYPCNIQFKYDGDKYYLLEVNTRMSGGIHMSCMASGVNIPVVAVNKLLGVRAAWQVDDTAKLVTYVEKPILL